MGAPLARRQLAQCKKHGCAQRPRQDLVAHAAAQAAAEVTALRP